MAEVKPFRGILYNPEKIGGELSDVCAPPYDIINDTQRNLLYDKNPNNIVKLILGKTLSQDSEKDNRYIRSGKLLAEWLSEGILVRDSAEAFYVYLQEYLYRDTVQRRVGFIGLMRLSENSCKEIFPHEKTFETQKKDRLLLLNSVKANLSPIFTLFSDNDKNVTRLLQKVMSSSSPIIDIDCENDKHKLWRLDHRRDIDEISSLMKDKKLFIADGHHRYEVAMAYRNNIKKNGADPGGADYCMMYFADMDATENLTILAAHRVCKGINVANDLDLTEKMGNYFNVTFHKNIMSLLSFMEKASMDKHIIGYYGKDKYICLELKENVNIDKLIDSGSGYENSIGKSDDWKKLDVAILHHVIFGGILKFVTSEGTIVYEKDPHRARDLVNNNGFDSVFFLNPTRVSQIKTVAEKGEIMPEKSTFFYPKLLTGLLINKF